MSEAATGTASKRGRPPKHGRALTAAERKAKSRARSVEGAISLLASPPPKVEQKPKPEPVAPKKAQPRERSDSVASKARIAQNAGNMHEPPAYTPLTDDQYCYWVAIMSARAFDDWCESDLVGAATLCRILDDHRREGELLRQEGYIVVDPELGVGRKNARFDIVDRLSKDAQAWYRTLKLGGIAAGHASVFGSAAKSELDMKRTVGDDGLLA